MLAAGFVLGAVAGCAGDDQPSVRTPDASAYAAALTPFLPPADPEEPPKIFVAPFNEPLVLENQVAIIDLLGDGYDVTFVDHTATAVDADSIGRPTRDDGSRPDRQDHAAAAGAPAPPRDRRPLVANRS